MEFQAGVWREIPGAQGDVVEQAETGGMALAGMVARTDQGGIVDPAGHDLVDGVEETPRRPALPFQRIPGWFPRSLTGSR